MNNIKSKPYYAYGLALALYKPFLSLEREYDITLDLDCYYVLRFDGKHMSSDYKIKNEPINKPFFKTMKSTLKDFCTADKKIIFAYSFSDEISILIKTDLKNTKYRLEKLLSLYASELSVLFYENAKKHNLTLKRLSLFDARILKVPKDKIKDYFYARQAFAIDRFIMKLKTKFNINPDLKKSNLVIRALKKQNINYENFSSEYRYGLMYHSNKQIKSFEFANHVALLNNILFNYENV